MLDFDTFLGVVNHTPLVAVDLVLVRGDPVADIDLLADPAANFALIMKDGAIVKDALP